MQLSWAARTTKARPAGLGNRVRGRPPPRVAPRSLPHAPGKGTPSCPPHLPKSTRQQAKPKPEPCLAVSFVLFHGDHFFPEQVNGPAVPGCALRPRQVLPIPRPIRESGDPATAGAPAHPLPGGRTGTRAGAGQDSEEGACSEPGRSARAPRRPRRAPERQPRPRPSAETGPPRPRAEAAGSVGRRHPRPVVRPLPRGLTASTACCRMEVNLENILSRDCSSLSRDDLESSSIRRRRPCCGCRGGSRVKAGAGGEDEQRAEAGPGPAASGVCGRRGGSGGRWDAAGGEEGARHGLGGPATLRRRLRLRLGHGGSPARVPSARSARRGLQGAPPRPGEARTGPYQRRGGRTPRGRGRRGRPRPAGGGSRASGLGSPHV
ncbi:translation initiation factor IF-2-like [Felis catus]|uniref:translation initiation factor IF-2-like n=1 Tax=Felis catus TaxID=9685 RepID=UPI001D19B3EA|nr:translation initiation factor IF-2-like [Felis catus]XP_044896658.1 translation initiation factor IF-2-like [Felis catus]